MWVWVKMKSLGTPQVSVHVSTCQGFLLILGFPTIFEPQPWSVPGGQFLAKTGRRHLHDHAGRGLHGIGPSGGERARQKIGRDWRETHFEQSKFGRPLSLGLVFCMTVSRPSLSSSFFFWGGRGASWWLISWVSAGRAGGCRQRASAQPGVSFFGECRVPCKNPAAEGESP